MSNKYTYSVPFTEEQLVEDYYNQGMSQTEIATKYGTTQKVVWKAMHKMGLQPRKAFKRNQTGEANTSWKGGRVLKKGSALYRHLTDSGKGYWMVRKPEHPNAGKNGYIFEHVYVALEAAGLERLEKGLVVHHINCDKQDNRPENLIICTEDKHREYHGKLENLVRQLLKNNLIHFDSEEGYVMGKEDILDA